MPIVLTPQQRRDCIDRIRRFPADLEAAIHGLTEEQLTARYDPTEWSVAQNVHHVVDSHMNAYIRTRLILTEDNPRVTAYKQDLWAELPDAKTPAVETSLHILRGLHARWTQLLDSLQPGDFARRGIHPDSDDYSIDNIVNTYARHGAGHIEQLQRQLAAGAKIG